MTVTTMKGGNLYRLRGKKLSATIIALVGTTILLWAWEKTPLVATLLSAQDQFLMSSSDVAMFASDPLESINKKRHIIKDSSDAVLVEETRTEPIEQDIAVVASDPLESTNKKENIIKDSSDSGLVEETRNKPIEKDIAMVASDPFESMNKKHTIQDSSDAVFIEETRNKPIEQGFDVAPISFSSISSQKGEDYMDFTKSSSENKVCNYAKGKWVADSRRPLYSGFGCKQWLSEMWACRLTQRTDFSYEGYRWKPKNCNMPEFERLKFLNMMQDKTIAFVGDSLGRQQFQSLMCMATGGEDSPEVENIGWKYGLVKARGAIRPDGWAYRFPSTNTSILYYWSATLCDLEALNITNPAIDYAMHLDRPAAFLSRYLHRFDVLVLNTGHHWNRGKLTANRWVMHINGTANIDRKLAGIGNAKNFTVYSVAKWLDSQLPQHPRLIAFFRTISPRHFVNGDWNTGGSCDNTIPLAGGSEVTQDESSDPIVESALKGTKIKILDITALSQVRDEGHISRYSLRPKEGMQDCLHWCLPGIPDTWNELLFAQL